MPPVTKSRGGDSPALVGTALQSTVSCVVCGYGELAVRRIFWRKRAEPGGPELVGNELAAAPEFGHRRDRCYKARVVS